MLAVDGGVPESRTGKSARIIIDVIRNLHSPEFTKDTYEESITADIKTSTQVITIKAEDDDTDDNDVSMSGLARPY